MSIEAVLCICVGAAGVAKAARRLTPWGTGQKGALEASPRDEMYTLRVRLAFWSFARPIVHDRA